jgi:uncharacterized protein
MGGSNGFAASERLLLCYFFIILPLLPERNQEMKPPRLKEIEAILRERRDELARDYGVTEIGVFGSCVRGEASSESDIDVLVEFNRPVGFFKFLELEERLGEWLGTKVDLVTKAALKPHIGRRILNEVAML